MTDTTSSQALPGLVYAFRFGSGQIAEELSVERPLPDRRDGWLWLHFDLRNPSASQSVKAISELPLAATMLLVDADEHQQLYAEESCTYGVFADLFEISDGATREIGFVHFAMTENLFVSSCRYSIDAKAILSENLKAMAGR